MKNIVLTGYRCTGKTSAGKILSEKLGLPFVDTDDLVMERAHMSIDDIVKKDGWGSFRRREKEAIKEVSSMRGVVISTGGGVLEDPENRNALKKEGIFIWLTADAETIIERMLSDRKSGTCRPSLSDKELHEETETILKKREPIYRESADLVIDTSKRGIEDAVCDILNFLENLAYNKKR
jgi:shikimate kinase